jgi:hypothetical protein
MANETEQIISSDAADRVLRQEYWDAVREYSTEIENAVKSGEIEDEDAMQERMHEMVDGSEWVIYTSNNFQVLRYCNNHDAYTEEFGDVPMSGSEVNWAALAFAAMMEDLRNMTESFDDLAPEDADDEDEEEDDEETDDEE